MLLNPISFLTFFAMCFSVAKRRVKQLMTTKQTDTLTQIHTMQINQNIGISAALRGTHGRDDGFLNVLRIACGYVAFYTHSHTDLLFGWLSARDTRRSAGSQRNSRLPPQRESTWVVGFRRLKCSHRLKVVSTQINHRRKLDEQPALQGSCPFFVFDFSL